MKAAITGASGHIGNCLIRELLKRDFRVRVLIHRTNSDLEELDIELIQGDVLLPESLNNLCENVDIVFHLAARISIDKKDREISYHTNVTGTSNLIDACLRGGVKRLIHFSSIHAINAHPLDEVLDETRTLIENSKSIYESSKAESERMVFKAAEKGLHAMVISPTAVIGPHDYNQSLLGQAIIKIYQNKLPMLVPGGYDFVDVRDVVKGAISAVEQGRKGEKYILSGSYFKLIQLSEMIEMISGRKTPKFEAPMQLARMGLPFIQLYAKLRNEDPLYTRESLEILVNANQHISNAKAKKELGYTTCSLEETLRHTFSWYKKHGIIQE